MFFWPKFTLGSKMSVNASFAFFSSKYLGFCYEKLECLQIAEPSSMERVLF